LLFGFGAGVLLGATFFDLLAEAIEAAGEVGWTRCEVLALTVCGFLVFYLGQRFLALQACPSGDCEANRHVGRMNALGLIMRSTNGRSVNRSRCLDLLARRRGSRRCHHRSRHHRWTEYDFVGDTRRFT
jgi:hypothetical protein